LRLLHTSDWHLGHTLHQQPRGYEHERFLEWLLATLEAEAVDALVVAGDLFDAANPPASAQAAFYEFIARARRRLPALEMVLIGGNHDSAARLDAPDPILGALGVRLVGGMPPAAALGRLVVPLRDRGGSVRAWIAAVPFLRAADLPPVEEAGLDPLVEGVRRVYAAVLEEARRKRSPGQALVTTGHLYMVNGKVSEQSERRILGGNQHALPLDLFPDDVAYAALGHLHKAQRVGGREAVRYSGSPLPLAMGEAGYRHQVCVVDLDGERLAGVRSLRVPRAVEVLRLPERNARPLEEVLPLLAALPPLDGEPEERRPYLEVRVALPRPEPSLRRRIEEALDGKAPRLVKLTLEPTGDGRALGEGAPVESLRDLGPEEVFLDRYRRDHAEPPPPSLLEAFHELLEQVEQAER
jgi:exonuclease SbcD